MAGGDEEEAVVRLAAKLDADHAARVAGADNLRHCIVCRHWSGPEEAEQVAGLNCRVVNGQFDFPPHKFSTNA